MKILAVDVGNTTTEFGVFVDEALACRFRLITKEKRTSDELTAFLSQMLALNGLATQDISDSIVSSVVPDVNHSLVSALAKLTGNAPIMIGPGIKTVISIKCDDPREVGADRIVDAVAAYIEYGGPVLVINFGTATRYDLVNEKGEFCAAVTAPGIKISADALWRNAAKLPQIEIAKPESVLAKNTITSMQAGLVYGQIGATEHIVHEMRKESGLNAKTVACGGYAGIIQPYTDAIDVYDPLLTMKGLKILYDKNRRK
ncbi:MAG: type III pantothenate kinase [Eubacteriaceae bacterium]|jgi:type III pantothenate kinase|nr:type III pantothenate kinase [Eubacteriaceae bacterium]